MARRQVIIPHIPWMKGVSLRATVGKKKHDCNHQGVLQSSSFRWHNAMTRFLLCGRLQRLAVPEVLPCELHLGSRN